MIAVAAAPGLAATNLQVTTAATGGMGATWIMRWAQSAEDGTMPLLHACAGTGVASGDLWEPRYMTGPPVKVALEPVCTEPRAAAELWKASEEAVGAWQL